MKISNLWHNWIIAIIGGSIATIIGGIILYYITNDNPPLIDQSLNDIETRKDSLRTKVKSIIANPIHIVDKSNIPEPLYLEPNYIKSIGIGEDLFDPSKAWTQALNNARADLINKFPSDKAQLVLRYETIIQDTIIVLERGGYRAQIVMQIDEHKIIL